MNLLTFLISMNFEVGHWPHGHPHHYYLGHLDVLSNQPEKLGV